MNLPPYSAFDTDERHEIGTPGVSDVVWLYQPPSASAIAVVGPFAELFGRALPQHARISHRWKAWIHPDDQTRVTDAFDHGLESGQYHQVFRLQLPDGSIRWLDDHAYRLGDSGLVRITRDLSPYREQAIDSATERWRNDAIIEHSAELIVLTDPALMVREVSLSYTRLLGYARAAVIGTKLVLSVHPEDRECAQALLLELAGKPDEDAAVQWRLVHAEGHVVWVEGTVRKLVRDAQFAGLVLSLRDARARLDAEQNLVQRVHDLEQDIAARAAELGHVKTQLQEAHRMQRTIMHALPDVLLRCDRDSRVLDVSGPVQQMAVAADELLGARLIDQPEMSEETRVLWLHTLHRAIDAGRNQICEYPLTIAAAERHFEARITPAGSGEAIAVVRDVTERNRLRHRLEHFALHDELTGLLSRNALRDRLNDRIAREPGKALALLVVDLDRFKQVNDSVGHAIGDTVLKIVANRIMRRAGAESLCARVSGDEFSLTVALGERSEARALLENFSSTLITELRHTMRLHGESIYVTPSIGVAIYPLDGGDAETLLRNADVAMMRAKQKGRNNWQFYDAALGEQAHAQFSSEQNLRRALQAEELGCVFQPKIAVVSGAMTGVEALARWNTPDGRTLSPDRFIPLAERTGLIRPLGRWILGEAMRQVSHFPLIGDQAIDLAINISVVQLRDSEFLAQLRDGLAEFRFAPARLTLEIAETAFVDDMQITADALAEIAQLGVRVSIDDFGTGYGGLSWLKNLPVQEIKIDRSFVKGCAIDAYDATIVSGLIEIAHNLGIQVVAEGVERADQIAFLTQMKCDVIQGFFLGRPMSALELLKTSRLWQPARA